MKLWGYFIPTTHPSDERVGLEREDEDAIRTYTDAMSRAQLVAVLQERGVPPSVPFLTRPQVQELLTIVPARGGIVVPRLDVFASAVDCARVIAACREKHVRLFIATIGEITQNTVAAAIVNGFADLERARKRERTLMGQASRRAAGMRVSGTVPFGYVLQDEFLVERPDQQRAIARMRELRRQGKSFRAIAAVLLKEFGSSPSAFGIQRIVDNKRKLDEAAIRRQAAPEQAGERPVKRFKTIGSPQENK